MREYHKIQTLFLRDPLTNHKHLLVGEFAKPEFEFLKDTLWIFTEKVDGTNIRVSWDHETVRFGGRTERAQIPTPLLECLMSTFNETTMQPVFNHGNVVLFGEGYGPKIQKGGGKYRDDPGFILFDVNISDMWLNRESVVDIADHLSIPVVPVIGEGDLKEVALLVEDGFKSDIASDITLNAEGIVLRPAVELSDRRGSRVIAKLKYKDFPR